MNKISTWLWFETEAEEAARFYASVFRNTKLGEVVHAPGGGEPYTKEGQVITAEFTIEGHQFFCLNGGKHPGGVPNDAVSFQILCADQKEVDEYWNKLIDAGATPMQCGWITDPFGVTWQIVPKRFMELISDPNPEKVQAVMNAMMTMVKLDVAALEQAYAQA